VSETFLTADQHTKGRSVIKVLENKYLSTMN